MWSSGIAVGLCSMLSFYRTQLHTPSLILSFSLFLFLFPSLFLFLFPSLFLPLHHSPFLSLTLSSYRAQIRAKRNTIFLLYSFLNKKGFAI